VTLDSHSFSISVVTRAPVSASILTSRTILSARMQQLQRLRQSCVHQRRVLRVHVERAVLRAARMPGGLVRDRSALTRRRIAARGVVGALGGVSSCVRLTGPVPEHPPPPFMGLGPNGKVDREPAATLWTGFNANGSPMRLDKPPDRCEPETKARFCRCTPSMLLEDFLTEIGSQSWAGVADLKANVVLDLASGNRDPPYRRIACEFHRVRNEIGRYANEHARTTRHD
jgi:hypothetical protein